jgi:hypothetical protein
MLLNELSEGDDSSSERRRSQSIGSESKSESESDASRPTNLDVNGVLGAIIHGPPNKRPANSTSGSSSSSSSAKTKGMYQHRTTLGNGRVVETRVSVRNQNKPVSKRRWTELNVEESLLSGTPKYSCLPPSAVTANVMERARPYNRSKKNKKRLFSASIGRNTTILFVKYTDKRIYGKITCLQI